ncbi:MAG: DUF6438 domain-containing protein [Gemmatimonadota bacterium]
MSAARTLTILIAAAMGAASCRRNAQPAADVGADTSLVVALERGACRGNCPEYRVELFESGRVLFTGAKNVAVTGAVTGTVRDGDLRAIKSLLSESGFASLDTAYVYGSTTCGQYYTDLPMVVLWAKVGTIVRKVQYDPGCQGAPAILKTLPARIDSVAGTSTWIEGKEKEQ